MSDEHRPWDRPGRRARPARQAGRHTAEELEALATATKKAIEEVGASPAGSPEAEHAIRVMIEASRAETEAFVDSFPEQQRKDVALNLYRDADNNLRTRHGALGAVPEETDRNKRSGS